MWVSWGRVGWDGHIIQPAYTVKRNKPNNQTKLKQKQTMAQLSTGNLDENIPQCLHYLVKLRVIVLFSLLFYDFHFFQRFIIF